MPVHEAGRDDQPVRVDHFSRFRGRDGTDRDDLAIPDEDVGTVPGNQMATFDHEIHLRLQSFLKSYL
ncbi:hypothetical protein Are01nite_65930 [Actinoplanes regularis]|nr:hypothetical protein Are01nite_65930 [Actinoplanes regularis]